MKQENKIIVGIFVLVIFVAFAYMLIPNTPSIPRIKVDDWKYNPGPGIMDSVKAIASNALSSGMQFSMSKESNLGFSTGGAKDINNFRQNIANDFLPIPTDITYEGLFYDYYFDTGDNTDCSKMFCPSYSYAVSKDPLSQKDDYYLSVGLNSNIKEEDFARKKLNLVVVLDISGSMSSVFDRYYYDSFGNRMPIEGTEGESKTKMEVATESVVGLLSHLNSDDRFGMVVYNDDAFVAKPLNLVGDTDVDEIKQHILDIRADGSTQMSAGMEKGTALFDELLEADQSEYENRIIFLTDAMPNRGETGKDGLLGMTEQNAGNKIYTTFIGIGVDFNTELVDYITKIRGANYYSVHSSKEFKERMDEQFEYMVTPLVFNLELSLIAPGYRIEKVYGSPEANEATGEIMKVNTLFPSKTEDGETKGGIVLLKLRKISSEDKTLKLRVTYENREGKKDSSESEINLDDKESEYFANNGIRKGILLSRYADLMKNWIIDERGSIDNHLPLKPSVDSEIGICPPPEPILGQWERQSVPLRVSSPYKKVMREFKDYFEQEAQEIGDKTLEQEIKILDKLAN